MNRWWGDPHSQSITLNNTLIFKLIGEFQPLDKSVLPSFPINIHHVAGLQPLIISVSTIMVVGVKMAYRAIKIKSLVINWIDDTDDDCYHY